MKSCGAAAPPRLKASAQARVSRPALELQSRGFAARPLRALPEGTQVTLLTGPWMASTDDGLVGWLPESDQDGFALEAVR
jgi:hypothetical protein